MKLRDIIDFIEGKIPQSLALDFDEVGFRGDYDLDMDIVQIKICMDLLPEYDDFDDTLIITHHPPLFVSKTPAYTIHSNWDIINGGANDALAEKLNVNVISPFDLNTGIGRVCEANVKFHDLKKSILENFSDVRITNMPEDDAVIKRVGIISGFGLKNPDYVKLSKENDVDVLISGDLTQETAILAKNLNVTLIDLKHHESEVPGLYALKDLLKELDVNVEVIDEKPIEELK